MSKPPAAMLRMLSHPVDQNGPSRADSASAAKKLFTFERNIFSKIHESKSEKHDVHSCQKLKRNGGVRRYSSNTYTDTHTGRLP